MTPLEMGIRAGLKGEDPRLNPFDFLREAQEWQRGHSWGVELFLVYQPAERKLEAVK